MTCFKKNQLLKVDKVASIQQDLHETGHRFAPVPIPLPFAGQLSVGYQLRAGLFNPAQRGFMSNRGRAANSINDGINIVAFTHRVQGGEGQTGFSPQSGDNQFLAARGFNGFDEIFVLPGIDTGPVN